MKHFPLIMQVRNQCC